MIITTLILRRISMFNWYYIMKISIGKAYDNGLADIDKQCQIQKETHSYYVKTKAAWSYTNVYWNAL